MARTFERSESSVHSFGVSPSSSGKRGGCPTTPKPRVSLPGWLTTSRSAATISHEWTVYASERDGCNEPPGPGTSAHRVFRLSRRVRGFLPQIRDRSTAVCDPLYGGRQPRIPDAAAARGRRRHLVQLFVEARNRRGKTSGSGLPRQDSALVMAASPDVERVLYAQRLLAMEAILPRVCNGGLVRVARLVAIPECLAQGPARLLFRSGLCHRTLRRVACDCASARRAARGLSHGQFSRDLPGSLREALVHPARRIPDCVWPARARSARERLRRAAHPGEGHSDAHRYRDVSADRSLSCLHHGSTRSRTPVCG